MAYQMYTTRALVLSVRDRIGADRMVRMYTEEAGMIDARAAGVREERSKMGDLLSGHHADIEEANFDKVIEEQKALAADDLVGALSFVSPQNFSDVVVRLLQAYMLRETNVKDICIDLAKAGKIESTWGDGNRKPSDRSLIKLKTVTHRVGI